MHYWREAIMLILYVAIQSTAFIAVWLVLLLLKINLVGKEPNILFMIILAAYGYFGMKFLWRDYRRMDFYLWTRRNRIDKHGK